MGQCEYQKMTITIGFQQNVFETTIYVSLIQKEVCMQPTVLLKVCFSVFHCTFGGRPTKRCKQRHHTHGGKSLNYIFML